MSRRFHDDWVAPAFLFVVAIVIIGSVRWMRTNDGGPRRPAHSEQAGEVSR